MPPDENPVTGAFSRLECLVGAAGLARLAQAHVAVVGLGAVGSFATEALARSGIGHLRLVDFDHVAPSNLNRQLFALTTTIGRPKVEVAAERLRLINPALGLDLRPIFFDADAAEALLAPPLHYVIDAIDALNPKIQLIQAALERRVPLISAMGAANRLDPTRIKLGDLTDSAVCPLARRVRKRLRRQGITRGVTAIWSEEPPAAATVPPSTVTPEEAEAVTLEARRGRERVIQPSLCAIPAIFGLTAAAHAIRRLLQLDRAHAEP